MLEASIRRTVAPDAFLESATPKPTSIRWLILFLMSLMYLILYGVVPAVNASEIKAGTRFTKELFEKLWDYHNEWTSEFFAELDRRGDPGRFDRAKAPIIMEILKRQLFSPHYIQHSARVLFVVGQANKQERGRFWRRSSTSLARKSSSAFKRAP